MIALAHRVLRAQMSEMTEKEQLLEGSGYRYHFERMLYFSRSARRAFSLEFVEARSKREIQKLLDVPAKKDWAFHFNGPVSDRVKGELTKALEK